MQCSVCYGLQGLDEVATGDREDLLLSFLPEKKHMGKLAVNKSSLVK